MDGLKRLYNKIRIFLLGIFTDRVKHHVIKDERTGKEHKLTVEKKLEKVCDHKTITEIAPTMWKCTGCNFVYFQIGYKVMLTERDLLNYLDDIAEHLKLELNDKQQTK